MQNIVVRIVLVIGSLMVTFLCVELGVRLLVSTGFLQVPKGAYVFDCFTKGSYYWIKLKANADCTLHSTAGAFADSHIKTNSMGLRSPEVVDPKPDGRLRILFIGDSFTLGWGVDEEQAFPRIVEHLLGEQFPGKNIEVVNAGLTAAGPTYTYLFTKNELEKLDPDIVVVNYYLFNDIAENLVNSEWEDIDHDGLPERVYSKVSYVDFQHNLRRFTPVVVSLPLLERSAVLDFANDALSRNLVDRRIITIETCFMKKSCDNPEIREAFAKNEKLVLAAKKLLDEKKKTLFITIIPAEFQVYQGRRFKYAINLPMSPEDKRHPGDIFSGFLDTNEIGNLDLLDVFSEYTDRELYFALDDHLNSEGHAIAARAIVDRMFKIIEESLRHGS